MDSSVHLVPGHYKLPTAPGGSLRKDGPGWEKAENKFTATSGLPACVCVCPVSPPYMHMCVPVCVCMFVCVRETTRDGQIERECVCMCEFRCETESVCL